MKFTKKTKVIILVILLLGILGYGYYYFAYKFNLLGDCADVQISTSVSPDSMYEADYFTRNCGATTDYSTHVAVKNMKTSSSESVIVLSGQFAQGIQLAWADNSNLKVDFTGDKNNIFKFNNKFENINVNLTNNNEQIQPR